MAGVAVILALAIILLICSGLLGAAFMPRNYRDRNSWIGQHVLYRDISDWINHGRKRDNSVQFPANKWHDKHPN
jgi:hypothetical protein